MSKYGPNNKEATRNKMIMDFWNTIKQISNEANEPIHVVGDRIQRYMGQGYSTITAVESVREDLGLLN